MTDKGGRLLAPPQNFAKRGEQAVFADPEGAIFGVMKSTSGDPADVLAEPGEWIWIQLLTRDARKAADFYRSVAGYEHGLISRGHGCGDALDDVDRDAGRKVPGHGGVQDPRVGRQPYAAQFRERGAGLRDRHFARWISTGTLDF